MPAWTPISMNSHDAGALPLDAAAPQLWWLPLGPAGAYDAALDEVRLEPEEARTIRPELRRARAWLRLVLARYVRQPPDALRFRREARGRPYLTEPAGGPEFSLAHSGDRMLLAVGLTRCGVDLEALAKPRRFAELALAYLGPEERAWVEACDGEGRARRFLQLWTAKEAVLKACGLGISDGLRAVRVAIAADGSLSPLALPEAAGDPARWRLIGFDPEPGYVASVATLRSVSPAALV